MLDWQLECLGMFVPTDMNDHGCIALQHTYSQSVARAVKWQLCSDLQKLELQLTS